jgi:type I restriction enzyme M protein
MRDQFLRSGDIVLIIKGNLGKVGIISDAPSPGKDGWISGQSSVVIRLERTTGINPIALFMLLRSEFGKTLVKTLASGSVIPFVQLRELKQLMVPIPSPEESEKAIVALNEEEALQQQIDALQKKQTSLAALCWSF